VETIAVALFLLLAVVVSGAFARMSPVPLPLVQIALGSIIASVANLGVALKPDIFFLLFLPPLLFLDGWRIPKEGLFRDKGTILELALGLVVFTVVGVGFFINWMIPDDESNPLAMRELHGSGQTAAMAVLQLVAEAGVVNAQQGAEPAFADLT
jgi:monovalent cation/hydrogen antiporter